ADVSRRAIDRQAGLGGAVLHRGIAADTGGSAGARQQQHVWKCAAHDERHRPAAAVAAAGGAGETRGPASAGRGCVRECGRWHEIGFAPMRWNGVARLLFVVGVAYCAYMLRPLGGGPAVNIGFSLVIAAMIIYLEDRLRHTSLANVFGALLGGAAGLLIARIL